MSALEKRMSSAAVALTTADNRVMVVKAAYKSYWSFPGGVVDQGETPRQAAAREVQEEVAIRVDPLHLQFKLVADRLSETAQTYQFVFEAQITDDDLAVIQLDKREIVEYAVVSRQEILDGEREYSQSTILWASGVTGYDEQVFRSASQSKR